MEFVHDRNVRGHVRGRTNSVNLDPKTENVVSHRLNVTVDHVSLGSGVSMVVILVLFTNFLISTTNKKLKTTVVDRVLCSY